MEAHTRYCKYPELAGLFCEGGSIHATAATQKVDLMSVAMEVLESLFARLTAEINECDLKVGAKREAAVVHLKECLGALQDSSVLQRIINKDELAPQMSVMSHLTSPKDFPLRDVSDSVGKAATVRSDSIAQAASPLLKSFLISKSGSALFTLAENLVKKKSDELTVAEELEAVKMKAMDAVDIDDPGQVTAFIDWKNSLEAMKSKLGQNKRSGNELKDTWQAMMKTVTTMVTDSVHQLQRKKLEKAMSTIESVLTSYESMSPEQRGAHDKMSWFEPIFDAKAKSMVDDYKACSCCIYYIMLVTRCSMSCNCVARCRVVVLCVVVWYIELLSVAIFVAYVVVPCPS